MKFLNRKLGRDLRRNWTQFFSVFLMATLSVLVYVGLEGVWYGMQTSVDDFIDESRLADAWIHGSYLTDDDLEYVIDLEDVGNAVLRTHLQVTGDVAGFQTHLQLETPGSEAFSRPRIVDGAEISNELDGIWINLEHAEVHGLNVGDHMEIEFGGRVQEVEVLGLIQSAAHMYFTGSATSVGPNTELHGYGVIPQVTLDELTGGMLLPNVMDIQGEVDGLRDAAIDRLGDRFVGYFEQETNFAIVSAMHQPGMLRDISFMFAFIFLSLAILTMYTTIKRLVDAQAKDIATLKALGYSNRSIGWHFASYGLSVGGLGAVIGIILAPPLSIFVLQTQDSFYIPDLTIGYNWTSFVVALLVVAICTLSAFGASRKASRGLPAHFLRGNTLKSGKPIFLERASGFWSRISFGIRWSMRDGLSHPVRLLMGVVGVSGSMVLLMTGFGMADSLDGLIVNSYGVDMTYTARLHVDPVSTIVDRDNLQEEWEGQWLQTLQFNTVDLDIAGSVLTVFDDGPYVNLLTSAGEPMTSDGVYVTEGFARMSDLEIGDLVTIRVSLDTDLYTFEVTGIVYPAAPQGLFMTAETWEDAGGVFWPQDLLVGERFDQETAEGDPLVQSVTLMDDARAAARLFVDGMDGVVMLIIVIGIMLVVVILYNLGALNFTERTRDYATLRVLGFHVSELRRIAMIENVVTTLIGWAIGIPIGYWFLDRYVDTFSSDFLVFYPDLYNINLVWATVIAMGFSLTTTLLLGRRLKKVDMAEAIKGVE